MKYKKRNKLLWAWIKRMVWDRRRDCYEDLRYPIIIKHNSCCYEKYTEEWISL